MCATRTCSEDAAQLLRVLPTPCRSCELLMLLLQVVDADAGACPAWPQVVELKGNIRVLARIRPLIEMERARAGGDVATEAAVRVVNEETLSVTGASTWEYEFDRVFGPSDGQAQV